MDVSSVVEYRSFLARIYGFETALEHAVASVPELVLEYRGRLGRLRQDLAALGLDTSEVEALPRCTSLALRTPAHVLGCLYVIERNMLVAGLIRRHLTSQLPEVATRASGYLEVSSYDAGGRLRTLGDALASYVRRGVAAPEAIVTSAVLSFRLQHHWYARVARRCSRSQTQPVHVRRSALPEHPQTAGPIQPRDAA